MGNLPIPPGITSDEAQTVYYTVMRTHRAALLAALLLLLTSALLQAHARQSQLHQAAGLASDSHDGLTISVDPWITPGRYKEKFPKKSPFAHGIVAVQVFIKNDGDEAVKINLDRIRLSVLIEEDNRQELRSLNAEEVADTLLLAKNGKDPTVKRIPLPIPIGGNKPTRDANWYEYKNAAQNAGLPSSVVGPHETLQGLLYFDLQGQTDLIKSSRLYIPNLATLKGNQAILYFDIPLGPSSE